MISLETAQSIALSIDSAILQRARLELSVQETLRLVGASPESGITILISDDDQLRQLNCQFLGIDEPTDVLSFPAGYVDPDTNTTYLGDVIISYQRATQQATEAGHPAEDELRLLAVHGTLHLLGYDHATLEDEAKMWKAQADILELVKRA
jgi:probable rRNA maturation factor